MDKKEYLLNEIHRLQTEQEHIIVLRLRIQNLVHHTMFSKPKSYKDK